MKKMKWLLNTAQKSIPRMLTALGGWGWVDGWYIHPNVKRGCPCLGIKPVSLVCQHFALTTRLNPRPDVYRKRYLCSYRLLNIATSQRIDDTQLNVVQIWPHMVLWTLWTNNLNHNLDKQLTARRWHLLSVIKYVLMRQIIHRHDPNIWKEKES
jgi:hypothetical protein